MVVAFHITANYVKRNITEQTLHVTDKEESFLLHWHFLQCSLALLTDKLNFMKQSSTWECDHHWLFQQKPKNV